MKVSVFGIADFPFGKKNLPDERLNKLKELFHSQKATGIQVDFTTEKDLKVADAIICPKEKKLDLLILDLEVIESRLQKQVSEQEEALLKHCQECLEKEIPLFQADLSEEEKKWLINNNLSTSKPIIFISKEEIDDLASLMHKVFNEAAIVCFLTANNKESRAWEIKKNSTAIEAAACVHTDIARGFIKAEVMAFNDLAKAGNIHQAKAQYIHQEDKDYIVQDGDVIEFKFSV